MGRSQVDTEALPLTHRLTILYLATPLAIWLLGWLEWWFGAPATRRPLPSYPIARATVGRTAEGRTLWLAEIPFDGRRPMERREQP